MWYCLVLWIIREKWSVVCDAAVIIIEVMLFLIMCGAWDTDVAVQCTLLYNIIHCYVIIISKLIFYSYIEPE